MYIVIEMQNGIIGGNVWNYDSREEAESKYYTVLSVAAISEIEFHTAMLVTNEGFVLECKCYKH